MRLGLGANCFLRGNVSHAESQMLYRLSDICLYTGTRAGGYPLAVLEAMAAGCAVVASDVPPANVQMLSQGCGVVVPAGNVEQTAQALTHLIRDEALRMQLGWQARSRVATENHPAAFCQLWLREPPKQQGESNA
jgi:glycosyltransferase involved in cell wall biosynthesis